MQMKELPSRQEMDRAAAKNQTHCYTCGNRLGAVKFECRACCEWQCSKACLTKHTKDMDRL